MIKISGRSLNIPFSERTIAVDGDNQTTQKQFRIDGLTYADWDFVLDTRMGNHPVNPIALEKTVDETGITLTWLILSNQIEQGNMSVAVRAFKGSAVWQTNIDSFTIAPSLNAPSDYPPPLPSEFGEMEQRVTQAKSDAQTASQRAAISETNALESEQNAAQSAREASESAAAALASEQNAKQSEDNAKTSETNASKSESAATQALSDLLAALGVRIATLGEDGKLTPSQIPALSINDVFEVPTADAMLALSAERGDVALIIVDDVVSDSYILAADDPTQAGNWKKLGVSYVANSGHAATSDTATDASQINGKRIVGMTSEDYGMAVKDPETLYLVAEAET